jgi:SAM-dependent methyltransferase
MLEPLVADLFPIDDTACVICSAVPPRAAASRLVRCSGCGLEFISPRPEPNKSRHWFEESYASVTRIESEFGPRRAAALEREAALVRKYVSSGRLLDVGCAGGTFARCFCEHDRWELHGVELSREAVARARRVPGFRVFHGDLFEAGYPTGWFDVVTILDTLQYAPRPDRLLGEICRVMKPDGLLIVELPGYHFRRLRDRGVLSWFSTNRWQRVDPRVRLHYFTATLFRRLTELCGFRLLAIVPEAPPEQSSAVGQATLGATFAVGRLLWRATGWELAPRLLYVLRRIPARGDRLNPEMLDLEARR